MVEKEAKPVDNSQAEPQAAVPVPFWGSKLKKLAKDILLLILRNAGTAIPYFDTQHFTAPTTSDDDPAPQCIAHSIGYQIEQYAFEQHGVAPHPGVTSPDAQTQARFSRCLIERRLNFLQQARDREFSNCGYKDSSIQLGHIQQRIEHFIHFLTRCIDQLDRPCPFPRSERHAQLGNEQAQCMQWLLP